MKPLLAQQSSSTPTPTTTTPNLQEIITAATEATLAAVCQEIDGTDALPIHERQTQSLLLTNGQELQLPTHEYQ